MSKFDPNIDGISYCQICKYPVIHPKIQGGRFVIKYAHMTCDTDKPNLAVWLEVWAEELGVNIRDLL